MKTLSHDDNELLHRMCETYDVDPRRGRKFAGDISRLIRCLEKERRMPTVGEVVREECLKAGVTLKDADVEYVLWEKTGYPCFWPDSTKTPEENLRMQVKEWAKSQGKQAKKTKKAKKTKEK